MLSVGGSRLRMVLEVVRFHVFCVSLLTTSTFAPTSVSRIGRMRKPRIVCADFGSWHVFGDVPADCPILSLFRPSRLRLPAPLWCLGSKGVPAIHIVYTTDFAVAGPVN